MRRPRSGRTRKRSAPAIACVSGQVPIDPATGKLADGIRAQTQRVLDNIEAIVRAAGGSRQRIVKLTFFISDWADFPAMNEVCIEVCTLMPRPAT